MKRNLFDDQKMRLGLFALTPNLSMGSNPTEYAKYKTFDKDTNGVITQAEYSLALKNWDKDGTTGISDAELAAAKAGKPRGPGEPEKIDTDKEPDSDSKIEPKEPPTGKSDTYHAISGGLTSIESGLREQAIAKPDAPVTAYVSQSGPKTDDKEKEAKKKEMAKLEDAASQELTKFQATEKTWAKGWGFKDKKDARGNPVPADPYDGYLEYGETTGSWKVSAGKEDKFTKADAYGFLKETTFYRKLNSYQKMALFQYLEKENAKMGDKPIDLFNTIYGVTQGQGQSPEWLTDPTKYIELVGDKDAVDKALGLLQKKLSKDGMKEDDKVDKYWQWATAFKRKDAKSISDLLGGDAEVANTQDLILLGGDGDKGEKVKPNYVNGPAVKTGIESAMAQYDKKHEVAKLKGRETDLLEILKNPDAVGLDDPNRGLVTTAKAIQDSKDAIGFADEKIAEHEKQSKVIGDIIEMQNKHDSLSTAAKLLAEVKTGKKKLEEVLPFLKKLNISVTTDGEIDAALTEIQTRQAQLQADMTSLAANNFDNEFWKENFTDKTGDAIDKYKGIKEKLKEEITLTKKAKTDLEKTLKDNEDHCELTQVQKALETADKGRQKLEAEINYALQIGDTSKLQTLTGLDEKTLALTLEGEAARNTFLAEKRKNFDIALKDLKDGRGTVMEFLNTGGDVLKAYSAVADELVKSHWSKQAEAAFEYQKEAKKTMGKSTHEDSRKTKPMTYAELKTATEPRKVDAERAKLAADLLKNRGDFGVMFGRNAEKEKQIQEGKFNEAQASAQTADAAVKHNKANKGSSRVKDFIEGTSSDLA